MVIRITGYILRKSARTGNFAHTKIDAYIRKLNTGRFGEGRSKSEQTMMNFLQAKMDSV